METDVFGAKAYHAHCRSCGWKSKRFDHKRQAINSANIHTAKTH